MVDSRHRERFDPAMELLFGVGNLLSLCAAGLILFAAILALRHVGGGGAVILLIAACCQLLVSLFWAINAISGFVGLSPFPGLGPEVFGALSVLSSGVFLMLAVGLVLVLLKVGAIRRHQAVVEEIRAGQTGS